MEDEDRDGMGALRVLQGEHAVFFPDVDPHGRDASVIYAAALSTLMFGRTLIAMHFPTALGSAGMVFAVFWIGTLLFGRDEKGGHSTPWRGLLIGGVAAGLMATSVSQTIMGRTAYNHATHLTLLLTLCLGLLWWGWKERSWWRIALAGGFAGVLPYTYPASRITPALFLFFGLSFLASHHVVNWDMVRRELRWAALFAGVAALVVAPLLIYFALQPEHLFLRSKHLWIFDSVRSKGDPLGTILNNVSEHLQVFGFEGDSYIRNNFAGQPMLSPVAAVFFWLGVGTAVRRWRWPASRLLLCWLVTMLVPSLLAWQDSTPGFLRMLAATPAVYLLVGMGLWQALSLLQGMFSREAATWVAVVAASVIFVALVAKGLDTYRSYFDKWAADPGVYWLYVVPRTTLFQMLNAQQDETGAIYLVPNAKNSYSYGYLNQSRAQVRFFRPSSPDLVHLIESALKENPELSSVKAVEGFGSFSWAGFGVERIAILLSKYGQYLGSEEYPDFTVHSYSNISFDRPWTLFDELDPLTVNYDGGISLLGIALGQGAEQVSSQKMLDLEKGRPIWMALRWQIVSELDIDYAFSLRLYNVDGERAIQEDDLLWSPIHSPTSHWREGEAVDTMALIIVPPDLPSGEYELRLVVYDFETLTPTVEIGVWEPELTLARLRLARDQAP